MERSTRIRGPRLVLEGDVLVRRTQRCVERTHLGEDPWCRHVACPRGRVVYRFPNLDFDIARKETDLLAYEGQLARYEAEGLDGQIVSFMQRKRHQHHQELELWRAFLNTAVADWKARASRHRRYAHYPMYSFFARCGQAALDLDDNDPALALLWGCGRNGFLTPPSRKPMRCARKYLAKRRALQLERLGFPPGCARILRKIPRAELGTGMLWVLRNQLWAPECHRYLRHLPVVTEVVLDLLEPWLRRHVTFPLLEEVSLLDRDEAVNVSTGIQMAVAGNYFQPGQRFTSFGEMLGPYHDQQHTDDDEFGIAPRPIRHPKALGNMDIPPPPFPGIAGSIEPLRDGQFLKQEGRVMSTCVGSITYRYRVAQGDTYFYRVLYPQRATAMIVRRSYREFLWQLEECLGPQNRPAPLARQHVEGWLEQQQERCR